MFLNAASKYVIVPIRSVVLLPKKVGCSRSLGEI